MGIEHAQLQEWASALGLSFLGAAPVGLPLAEDRERLRVWQERQQHGGMAFMARPPELLTTPHQLMPSATSLVSFAAFYDRGPAPHSLPVGFGRVARYAWGRDYHRVLKRTLELLVAKVTSALGRPVQARIFSDAVPLLERAIGREVGGGFVGKNTMLIQPSGRGSFFFLCEVLWDVEVEDQKEVRSPSENQGSCGSCTRCVTRCPTEAFPEPYVLDARRCISYLSIEKRGALTEWERAALGEWVFGCDVCQEVCPFNHQALKAESPASLVQLSASSGVGHRLDLKELLTLRTDGEFVERFGGTALMRTKREGLLRNASVVAGNTVAEQLVDQLSDCVREDPSPVIRSHALWAVAKIQNKAGGFSAHLEGLIAIALKDVDAQVKAQGAALLL